MKNGTFHEALRAGFSPEQAGMLARLGCETRNEALDEFKKQNPVIKLSLRKRIFRAFFVYGVDVSLVLLVWIYGVGLTIRNWPLLIGVMFGVRFFWHIVQCAVAINDANAARRAMDRCVK